MTYFIFTTKRLVKSTNMNNVSLDDLVKLGYSSHNPTNGQTVDQYASVITKSNMANNAYGINHRAQPLAIPMNRDSYGLTFFTRPQLNLQRGNIRMSRIMHPLLTDNELSWQRYIRCMLDPRLDSSFGANEIARQQAAGLDSRDIVNKYSNSEVSCPLVDPKQAFIPLLSNAIMTISGWKDVTVHAMTTRAGRYREEFSMVDGLAVDYGAYDLTASFRNMRGDPITSLFYYWIHYTASVFEGSMVPYPDFLLNNELDYCTRIYRLVLDPSRKKVQRIAACGAAFPTAAPTVGVFDFSRDKPYNDVNADISIPFRAMGFICQDDILVRSFNEIVAIFNPDMRPDMQMDRLENPTGAWSVYDKPGRNMVKISQELLQLFNHRGYPRIDPETYELEWYVDYREYKEKIDALENFDEYLYNAMSNNQDNDRDNGVNYYENMNSNKELSGA